jgi:hypothetical protein
MPRRFIRNDNWEFGGRPVPSEDETGEPKPRKRRLATTLLFTTLFFSGASLAAVAGDQMSRYLPSDEFAEAEAVETTTTAEAEAAPEAAPAEAAPAEAAPAEAAAPEAAPAEAAEAEAAAPESEAAGEESEPSAEDLAAEASSLRPKRGNSSAGAASAPARGSGRSVAHVPTRAQRAREHKARLRAILLPKVKPAPAPEIEGPADAATIWLNSQLPDPTPPALRLSSRFAANLKKAAKQSGVDWAVMLGVLRARGATGHVPADRVTLGRLAARLGSFGEKGDWARVVAYSGDTRFADKAAALARYNRAVGLKALVYGLEASKKTIAARLLSDPMVSIYSGGRNDIVANKVDVRVLVLIAYLRESFGQVSVSSLISGHRLYARPGVVSAHIPGHAVDISGLAGTSIHGHQSPGDVTERAVRAILMLPGEVMPRQVISLLGMGGPSFPLADHHDHIHVGY